MIKKLAAHIRQYKKQAIATPLFMIGEVSMETVIPLVMSWLIDRGITPGNLNQIWLYGLILLGTAMISLFSGVMSGRMAAVSSAGFARNLRHDMYYMIQDYSFSNIDRFSTSSIITRLTTDVTNVQNAFQMALIIATRAPITLIASLTMCLIISPSLSVVFFVAMAILGVALFTIMFKTLPLFGASSSATTTSMPACRRTSPRSASSRPTCGRTTRSESSGRRRRTSTRCSARRS